MDAILNPRGRPAAERASRVAAIAAKHADDVDRQARFPREAVDAMISERLLSIQIPASLGGEGATTAADCGSLHDHRSGLRGLGHGLLPCITSSFPAL